MTRLVLAGNAVTAQILLAYLQGDTRYEVAATTVDYAYVGHGADSAVPCVSIGQLPHAHSPGSCRILMAMGYDNLNRSRERMFQQLKDMGYAIETYVHPQAMVQASSRLGEGSIVLPGAVLEPFAVVGANTMVWCNVTIAHHSTVGDNCWVAAGTVVAGHASIGRNSFIGVNATIVNKVAVAELNVIGASALITRNTKPGTVHLARSAEPLRYSSEEYVKHFGT